MAKTLTISQDDFKKGLVLLQDDSKAPFGSAQRMLNAIITDRGGVAPRPGTQIVGTYNNSALPTRGLYNFRKSKSQPNILLKSYDDELEYFHPTLQEWAKLKDNFTADQEFGFSYSLVNTDNDDFTYFCNRHEEYQRWSGATTFTTSALVGGETEIPVDNLLSVPIYLSETATSNSATTLTVSTANWAVDMWKNLYVYIPSTGKVRLITSNTSTALTFTTLGIGPGNVAFEIRQLAFPLTGTVIYNGTNIAYTTIDVYNELPVTSAHAAPDNTPLTIVPTEYIEAPRGNRIDTLKGRVYVGKVRSALSRDTSGNIQGSVQAGSIFVSKLLNPTDFSFGSSRTAGEGDILNIAYGGGDIADVKAFEGGVAIYKQDYIEEVRYTEDVNDVALRTPLKTGVGSVSRVIKGTDDHYFMTPDKKFTSLGRVRQKDLKPETENMGYIVKRLLDGYNFSNFNGIEYNNRILCSMKSSDDAQYNDIMLVYNKQTRAFEGIWSIGANNFELFKGINDEKEELLYGESNGANVWKMFLDRKVDARDNTTFLPYTTIWQSNFFNALPIKSNIQAINSIAVEGYIRGNTTFTFNLFKDFEATPIFSFNFGGDELNLLQGNDLTQFYSSDPFGTVPIGGISGPDSQGRRRFSFIVYLPYQYGQYFSTGLQSSGLDQDWEIIRISLGLKEDVSTKVANIKTL